MLGRLYRIAASRPSANQRPGRWQIITDRKAHNSGDWLWTLARGCKRDGFEVKIEKKHILPSLASAGLIALLFVDRPNWQSARQRKTIAPTPAVITKHEVPAGKIIIGAIDSHDDHGVIHGESGYLLQAFGWIASTNAHDPIQRLEIIINGQTAATVQKLLPRPDVAAYFDRSDFNLSGWIAVVPLDDFKAGEYEFAVRAVTSTGKEDALPSLKLVVSE